MAPEPSEGARRAAERFTNQKRFVATEKEIQTKWGLDGKALKCGICGHKFAVGDGVRWVYANGQSPSYCNFFTCDGCDGEDVLQRRTAAGNLAKSLDFDEIVLAAQLIDRETHSAEMRKALVKAFGWIGFFARCMDRGESLSAEDERELSALVGEIQAALKGGAL